MTQAKLDRFTKDVHITYCSCNKYLEKNQWKPYKSMKEVVSRKIRARAPRAKLDFEDFEFPDRHKQIVENEVVVKSKNKEHVIKVVLKLTKCNLCGKEGTEYYEAVLQIRSSNLNVLERSVEFLKQRVENLRHKGMFINKVRRQSEGYDLYMTNKSSAQALGRELYDTYGGVYKASPHLHTRDRQKSKNVYRVNVFVRLPGFEKGDVIVTDKDLVYKVEKLGKKIKLLDLDKDCLVSLEYSKLTYHVLKKHATYVSRIHPGLEVINPFDFQSSWIKNQVKEQFELGQEVKVVVHKGVYVVD